MKFIKIIGFRPAIEKFSHILLRGNNNTDSYTTNTINLKCWDLCKNDQDCSGYVIFYTTSECYGFTQNSRSPNYDYLDTAIDLIPDSNAIYFEKKCLDGKCDHRVCVYKHPV